MIIGEGPGAEEDERAEGDVPRGQAIRGAPEVVGGHPEVLTDQPLPDRYVAEFLDLYPLIKLELTSGAGVFSRGHLDHGEPPMRSGRAVERRPLFHSLSGPGVLPKSAGRWFDPSRAHQ